ncbi:hypothetical protein M011DRAFT_469418 [Sporormia fimetaria CBS 119925]|uniref:Uncharacterized protein n=1 Tax=Sporormia fimetaria CBS 119925 TaxID=1340428 RepID=A0A6A6V8X7_9PLEO|nr:hypothetical protein M011DRAFT_469418 [Sporormia fimetaria CBS 119925]
MSTSTKVSSAVGTAAEVIITPFIVLLAVGVKMVYFSPLLLKWFNAKSPLSVHPSRFDGTVSFLAGLAGPES